MRGVVDLNRAKVCASGAGDFAKVASAFEAIKKQPLTAFSERKRSLVAAALRLADWAGCRTPPVVPMPAQIKCQGFGVHHAASLTETRVTLQAST